MHKVRMNYTQYLDFLKFWEANPSLNEQEAVKLFLHLKTIPY